MKSRQVIAALLVGGALLAGSQVLAHHAGTMFSEEVKEIAGTVKEFQFTNPHSWIQVMVETTPGAPPQEWSVEWGSPNQLGRNGIRPMRDGSPAAGFVGAKFEDGKTVGNYK